MQLLKQTVKCQKNYKKMVLTILIWIGRRICTTACFVFAFVYGRITAKKAFPFSNLPSL